MNGITPLAATSSAQSSSHSAVLAAPALSPVALSLLSLAESVALTDQIEISHVALQAMAELLLRQATLGSHKLLH